MTYFCKDLLFWLVALINEQLLRLLVGHKIALEGTTADKLPLGLDDPSLLQD